MNIAEEAKKIAGTLVAWRRELHQCPEVGLDTPVTAAFISVRLRQMGIDHRRNIGGSGVAGIVRGASQGKTLALRSDMDGLPIREETGLPFASTNGSMHACGHDAHMAMLLGAAKLLQDNRSLLKGNVKLIFQPGEEGLGGAKRMIEDGVLEDPQVDAILGQHIFITEHLLPGQVGVYYGSMMASMDHFRMKIIGRGCHGAMPEKGIDPVVLAGQIITALQTIISREISPLRPAVLTIGKIHGGSAFNIIPDEVELEGTVRTLHQEVREKIAARMGEIVRGITGASGGSCEFAYDFGYPPLVNDIKFTGEFAASAAKIVGEKNVVVLPTPTMVSEDMAYYLEKVPGTFCELGGNLNQGESFPHHSSRFDINEDVFWKGAAVMARAAFDWLERNGAL
ncbi:MAG: M20 family metallopeptidase [Syntrophales bacterium]|jgi:amidohydrolase|nr:M20 family metallopeptidase [Syntrophales bacterium]